MSLSDLYATIVARRTTRTVAEIQDEIDEISATRQKAWQKRSQAINEANPYIGIPRDPDYSKLMEECRTRLKELELEKRTALARENRSGKSV